MGYIHSNYSFSSIQHFINEFYPETVDPELIKLHRRMFDKLKTRGVQAVNTNSRGCDLFSMNLMGEHVGGIIVEYYPWDLIKNQRYFNTSKSIEGLNDYIWQERFEDLIKPSRTPRFVFEIAYMWVTKRFRGWKYSRNLWDHAVNHISELSNHGDILMTMSMSAHAKSGKGQKVFDWILELERQTNGINDSNNQVNLTGVKCSSFEILLGTGVDVSNIICRIDSKPTESLAYNSGMRMKGYSRNLSPVFTKEL
jgi:hypothetical protein